MKDALIVDDHPVVRAAIKGLLEKEFPDIRVTECDGKTSVVNRICGANWVFVVLDMNLPDRNGLDILKAVKETGNRVPIVVFSLYAEDQYAARALLWWTSFAMRRKKASPTEPISSCMLHGHSLISSPQIWSLWSESVNVSLNLRDTVSALA